MTSTVISRLPYQRQAVAASPAGGHTFSAVLPMPRSREDEWTAALNHLIGLYRDVERRSLTLPPFSIVPILVYLWNCVKFSFFLYADLVLLIPLNVVIFLRNLLPGRWRYRSFSGKYLKYAARWIWNGEVYAATVHVRWFTKYLLYLHFRLRFNLLLRHLLLEDMDAKRCDTLLSQIDRTLQSWPRHDIFAFAFTYGLPVFGWALNAAKDLYGHELSGVLSILSVILLPYALGVVGSAFFVKRGLMLGGRGSDAYYGGALAGSGVYQDEAQILQSLGVRAREFPLDVLIMFLGFGPSLYSELVLTPASASIDYELLMGTYGIVLSITIGVVILATWRRRKLGRA